MRVFFAFHEIIQIHLAGREKPDDCYKLADEGAHDLEEFGAKVVQLDKMPQVDRDYLGLPE